MESMDNLLKAVYLPTSARDYVRMSKEYREHLMYWNYPVTGMTDLEFRLYYMIPANEFYDFKKGQRISILHMSKGKKIEFV